MLALLITVIMLSILALIAIELIGVMLMAPIWALVLKPVVFVIGALCLISLIASAYRSAKDQDKESKKEEKK